jgi:16S rRNA (cytidine1402-2'-O)-methyltransferase
MAADEKKQVDVPVADPDTQANMMRPGVLYLVGTPIGNLQDLSARVIATLAEADWIAAEDTRRTLKLLTYLGLKKHLVSYHQHNHRQRVVQLLEKLQLGGKVALVSDAGMPAISDPGAELVSACLTAGIAVTVVPGPTAAITALAASGLSTERFTFEGFLPTAGKARKLRLLELVTERRTMVIYEAPHRLQKTLLHLDQAGLGVRRLTIARELTKKFESYQLTTVTEAVEQAEQQETRGEFVLVLEGLDAFTQRLSMDKSAETLPGPDQHGITGLHQQAADTGEAAENKRQADLKRLNQLLDQGMSLRDAVRQLAKDSDLSRNDWYSLALTRDQEEKIKY